MLLNFRMLLKSAKLLEEKVTCLSPFFFPRQPARDISQVASAKPASNFYPRTETDQTFFRSHYLCHVLRVPNMGSTSQAKLYLYSPKSQITTRRTISKESMTFLVTFCQAEQNGRQKAALDYKNSNTNKKDINLTNYSVKN